MGTCCIILIQSWSLFLFLFGLEKFLSVGNASCDLSSTCPEVVHLLKLWSTNCCSLFSLPLPMQSISFKSTPNVLIFEINSRNIKLNKTLKFEQEGETVVLDVRGLIYCTILTVSSWILKICWQRWLINFLLNSSDLKWWLFFWLWHVTELMVEMVQYHGDFHFTSCIIGTDGMTTGSSCENEGDFDKLSSRNLLKCKGKKLILVVYARV